MLEEIGLHVESADVNWCFYSFDVNLNKVIDITEFSDTIRLTGYELDLVIDRIRKRLLALTGAKTVNKLRDSRILSKVFKHVNTSYSSVLSLDELMSFAAKIDVYITNEEGQMMLKLMDKNNNQRVEESEFIEFCKRDNMVLSNKIERVQGAALKLRAWLERGHGATAPGTPAGASTPSKGAFKTRYHSLPYSLMTLLLLQT